jgi:hypothetical protein
MDKEFLCERHGCSMKGVWGCANYQAQRPERCEGCTQPNRSKTIGGIKRVVWTQNAIETKKTSRRRASGAITLDDLNEVIHGRNVSHNT